MNEDIRPISIPGIHDKFVSFFVNVIGRDKNMKVLDAGAGQGALTKRFHEEGFNVSACDLFPERFKYNKAEFKKADLTKSLPYDDNSFDVIVAVEVLEYLIDHEIFFIEQGLSRVLKNTNLFEGIFNDSIVHPRYFYLWQRADPIHDHRIECLFAKPYF